MLQDIGWDEHDPRERYVLTMPPDELTGLLLLAGVTWTPAVVERQVEAGYRVVFEVDPTEEE